MSTQIDRHEPANEMGFGRGANNAGLRLLNRDGSFNVLRRGLPFRTSRSLYTSVVTMSWPRFYACLVSAYLLTNFCFAMLYLLCGRESLSVPDDHTLGRFATTFFFSVQTLATIGYGHVSPVGLSANCLVTAEAFVGLLGMSIATGFLFARLSRPTARILFSDRAVIAPFHGGKGFMFRLANGRSSQLVEVEIRLILTQLEGEGEKRKRSFCTLDLEYKKVSFLALSWTVVHPIVESSPLWGVSESELIAKDAEFLILLSAIDDIFSQGTHARTSYKAHEILWDSRFVNLYDQPTPGLPAAVDLNKLSVTETAL